MLVRKKYIIGPHRTGESATLLPNLVDPRMQDCAEKEFCLAFDGTKTLIDAGIEKGYLTFNEVNELIPHDVHSPEDLDDLLTTLGMQGIDVLEGQPKLRSAVEKKFEKGVVAGEDIELPLTPGAFEKTNDPVRIYLREMGMVPLLTREGEVDISKRIERGELRVLKVLSRSPIVIRLILAMGNDLKCGVRSIKEIVVFPEEEMTEEILQNRVKEITPRIDELQKHYKRAGHLAGRLSIILAAKKAREYSRCRCRLGREIVRISLIIRNLGLTLSERPVIRAPASVIRRSLQAPQGGSSWLVKWSSWARRVPPSGPSRVPCPS